MVTDRWRAEVETAPHLDGLLASILEKLVQQRLRVGLGRDYLQKSGLLRTLRGRIDFGRSVKGLTLQHNQLYCHFHEFSADVPKNQIIRSTLNRIVRIGEFGQDRTKSAPLKHRLRRLVRDLDQIQVIELNLDLIRRQNLGRNDRDYGFMLAICELLASPPHAHGACRFTRFALCRSRLAYAVPGVRTVCRALLPNAPGGLDRQTASLPGLEHRKGMRKPPGNATRPTP